jgi:predicted DNA-binding protein with PD1-like motif
MRYQELDQRYVLRLEPGEEVVSTLTEFVNDRDVRGGYFIAFGAFERTTLLYFNLKTKEYEPNDVGRQVEVVSLMGNVARLSNGEPKLHIHGAVADDEAKTYSGHLKEGIVRPTLEVFLTLFDGEIRRSKDPSTGLDLLDLPRKSGS